MMRLLVWGVSILFGLLCMYAAAVQLSDPKHKAPCLLMVAGGFVLLCAVAASRESWTQDWMIALAGCAAICAAAFWNSRRDGIIHYSHHLVRLALCTALVVGFVFY